MLEFREMKKLTVLLRQHFSYPYQFIQIPYTDLKNTINAYFNRIWQNHWSQIQFNKLQSIKPIIGETKLKSVTKRRDEVVLHRARIGHTFLTHSYLLKKEDGPDCSSCHCLLTVQHILIDCLIINLLGQNILHPITYMISLKMLILYLL